MEKRMKVNLKQDDSKLELILRNMSDVIWIIGFDDHDSYVTPSIFSFTGYEPQEFLKFSFENILAKDSVVKADQLFEHYLDIYRTLSNTEEFLKYSRQLELEFICKDHSHKWAEVKANLYKDADGRIIGSHLVLRDITERKRFEENTVKMLNKEKELNKFKTQVISTISHEFRTPISIIYSNLQLLKKFSYKIDEEIRKDAFELTTIAIQSLSKTLDNLTLLNQSNKGVLNYSPVEFNLLAECKKITNEISSINHFEGRIIINFEFPDTVVRMDKTLLNHMLSNILVNALKFSPDDTKIEFSLNELEGEKAQFIIKDKGIGIPEEELQLIFESFYRGSNSKNVKGTGLGLSIVKRCVDLQKGSMEIKSELENGTEAIVILPYERNQ